MKMVEASATLEPADRAREADHPHSLVVRFGPDKPLKLDAGVDLSPFQIAYQTYGTLNAAKSNLVLVCHALTGDQHVANIHPVTGKPGWWETMVGPGKPIDTNRYFVLCANVIGGCMGSTGPSSINPATGRPYGLDFPVITVRDMVRAQARLLDHLNIPDVRKVSNYLACSTETRSELVILIRSGDRIHAQIDIDSHELDAFDPDTVSQVEKVADWLAIAYASLRKHERPAPTAS